MSNVVATAVKDVAGELDRLETVYTQRKGQLVGVIQNHIADHQKQAAAHAQEIAAAQAVLAKAVPQPAQPEGAAFVLTAPSKIASFLERYWRYAVGAGIVGGIVLALHVGLVKL